MKFILSIFLLLFLPQIGFSDVYINVMAVNGSTYAKETPVKYSLPGDLKGGDILDTDGLKLEYDVNEGGYFVSGSVNLEPKASKTYRVRVRDVWKVTQEQIDEITSQIQEASQKLVDPEHPQNAEILKKQLQDKLDFIAEQQAAGSDNIEKRIDTYRTYVDQMNEIRRNSLSVDYWRSEPGEILQPKLIRMNIEVENPAKVVKTLKHQHFLPLEIKPEQVVEKESFDIRFDPSQSRSFLFKEEEFQPLEKKKYVIGIQDIWYVPQIRMDDLKKRSDKTYEVLKDTKYAQSAKFIYDRIPPALQSIEESQAVSREILEHISAYRKDQVVFDRTREDVEELERLLALYREDLEKTQVDNVLKKIRAFNGMSSVSEKLFNKKPSDGTAWSIISLVLVFVGIYTIVHFLVWFLQANKQKKNTSEEKKQEAPQEKMKV